MSPDVTHGFLWTEAAVIRRARKMRTKCGRACLPFPMVQEKSARGKSMASSSLWHLAPLTPWIPGIYLWVCCVQTGSSVLHLQTACKIWQAFSESHRSHSDPRMNRNRLRSGAGIVVYHSFFIISIRNYEMSIKNNLLTQDSIMVSTYPQLSRYSTWSILITPKSFFKPLRNTSTPYWPPIMCILSL